MTTISPTSALNTDMALVAATAVPPALTPARGGTGIANAGTLTVPATGTAALLGTTQTFDGAKTFSAVLDSSNTTDASSPTVASVVLAGGMGFGLTKSIFGGGFKSVSPTLGIGYATGAGGAVTQVTSRTTDVTLNTICGAITLVSAAGSATYQSFTVTNSTVAATDTIRCVQRSGTDLNLIHITAVAAGSFRVSFATTGGTTTEQPVFNFSVIKSVAA